MIYVGIDPGKNGAVAILRGQEWELHVMRDALWFADLMESLKKEGPFIVTLERAQSMPGNGAKAMFSYGTHFGELMGVMQALRVPFQTVPPLVWTKALHETSKESMGPKARSLQAVQRLFPSLRLTDPASDRAKVPHDGIIDAVLICEYGKRKQWMTL